MTTPDEVLAAREDERADDVHAAEIHERHATIATADGRVIPPPTEADMACDLMEWYKYYLTPRGLPHAANDAEAILSRRYHAAEAEVRRQAEEIVNVCAERDALYAEVQARDLEIGSLREFITRLRRAVNESVNEHHCGEYGCGKCDKWAALLKETGGIGEAVTLGEYLAAAKGASHE